MSIDISTEQFRKRLTQTLQDAVHSTNPTVVDAPTSLGKSHMVATMPWNQMDEATGGEPVVLLTKTRRARDEAYENAQEAGLRVEKLLGYQDSYPLAKGDYDHDNESDNDAVPAPDGSDPSKYFEEHCSTLGKSPARVHGEIERSHIGNLPCCDSVSCTEEAGVDYENLVSKDLIVATHSFARVENLIEGRIVIFDEQPDVFALDASKLEWGIKAFLDAADVTGSVKNLGNLGAAVVDGEQKVLAAAEKASYHNLSSSWYRDDKTGHLNAAGLLRAVATAEQRLVDRWVGEVSFERPDIYYGNSESTTTANIRVVLDENGKITEYQELPDLSVAKTVIGLDATPAKLRWEMMISEEVEVRQLLTEEEKQARRQDERGLEIIQVGTENNSWTRGISASAQQDLRTLIWYLRGEHGDQFRSAITSKSVEHTLEQLMKTEGVEAPVTLHHGNLKSHNGMKGERVGLIAGCISPSTEKIKDWLAILGYQARSARENDLSKDPMSFVGPDADKAAELIASVREHGLIQAAGRYARSPGTPDGGATVYVFSSKIPANYVDDWLALPPVQTLKQRRILGAIDGNVRIIDEVIEETESSRSYVSRILNEFVDAGLAKREKSNRPGKPYVYSADVVLC